MASATADAFFILTQKRLSNFTGSIRQEGEPFPEATPEERTRLDKIRRELPG